MNVDRLTRRIAIVTGGAALVVMGSLSACSATTEKEAPSTTSTPTTSSSAPAPSPTEKAMLPGGDESFTPKLDPTPPGAVCKQIVNGVCMR